MFWSESKDIHTLCDLYVFNTMEGFFLQNVKLFLFHHQAKKCNGVFIDMTEPYLLRSFLRQ